MIKIKTFVSPYEHASQDGYTAYYRVGLAQFINSAGGTFAEVSVSKHPQVLRLLQQLRYSYKFGKIMGKFESVGYATLDSLARVIGGSATQRTEEFDAGVGRYLFQTPDGHELKVYIDYRDNGEILSPKALDWSDVYFKTSYLLEHDYPAKVIPLSQCSALLVGRIDRLRSLRIQPKRYDLCFTTRVWGGSNDIEGIEHNLRLFEALAQINCRKYLRAFLIAGDKAVYAKRLDRLGIPWSFAPLSLSDHLDVLASSRLNIHRLGMHNSITWRMSELLCMGACPVLDQHPRTLWPEPLQEQVNYLTLNVAPPRGSWIATDAQYAAIPERLTCFLKNPAMAEQIAMANQQYFDKYLEPVSVGRWICEQVMNLQAPTKNTAEIVNRH